MKIVKPQKLIFILKLVGAVASGINLLTYPVLAQAEPQPELEIESTTEVSQPSPEQTATPTVQSSPVTILSPTPETILDVPAATITVQSQLGLEIELQVNGENVDSSLIGRTQTDEGARLVTQTWYGVGLEEGDNLITATVKGSAEAMASVSVQVRGAPQELVVETREAGIPADGRSTATVVGQLLDKNGNPTNRDAIVTLFTSAGEFVGIDEKPDQPGFQVQAQQGQFTAQLRSELEAQTVRIRATTTNLEGFSQFQFKTALRPSLLSGVINIRWGARGTDYFGRFEDFLPADRDNDYRLDLSSAVFATGTIGEWLYTGAYNSDRSLNEDCNCDNRLFREYQSDERGYPVYGDSSTVDVITPSTDQVYFRLERSPQIQGADPDYLMWGDYNTSDFTSSSQICTAVTRQLHGFKANYNLGNLQISGFYGDNVEGFQRDTIVPDGTSGNYFLSRRLVVPGSEDIFIELEELERPGTVLKRERLSQGADYEIDYDRGSLFFRQPLLRTDLDEEGRILVRRIVATYQFEGEDEETDIYAGRVRYHLSRELNQESWIGATYLREDKGNRDFELYGADAFFSLGENGHLIAE
ncbi:MAG: hypothetical protein WA919_18355, partial [Coleofasciculaceae cyanobacterium]